MSVILGVILFPFYVVGVYTYRVLRKLYGILFIPGDDYTIL